MDNRFDVGLDGERRTQRGAGAMVLSGFAERVLEEGDLTIIDAAGRRQRFGDGRGQRVVIRLHDKSLHYRLALNPYLYVGEAYTDGTLTLEQGSLYDLIDIWAANVGRVAAHPLSRMIEAAERLLRGLHQYNPAPRARANVAHHYDLSDALYDLFLDADRQYSCAYFSHDHDALDLLVVCVESGLGLAAAIQRVADELGVSHPELAFELALVNAEIRVGVQREQALKNLADRTGLEDIRGLVGLLVQTMRFGTGVADALRVYSEEFRDKRTQKAEEQAAKMGTKLVFPLVLFMFPIFFIVAVGPAVLRIIDAFAQVGAG
jgi:hypothetical protein